VSVLLDARELSAGHDRRRILYDLTVAVPSTGTGVGIVGESGAGKTTAMLALARLIPLYGGTLTVCGQEVGRLRGRRLKEFRRTVQIVPQEGDTPLDPRRTVADAVAEGLGAHRLVPRAGRAAAVSDLLGAVGLAEHLATRYPHQLSGGQRQRVAVARALAVRPRLIIADEPTSALDLVNQVRIIELLRGLRDACDVALVLVSHDLAVVGALCAEVVVLLGGRVVERGPYREVVATPGHPHTAALAAAERQLSFTPLTAVPAGGHTGTTGTNDAPAEPLNAEPLNAEPLNAEPLNAEPLAETGCAYRARCLVADDQCLVRPRLQSVGPNRWVACHHPGTVGYGAGRGAASR
jgi:peptide/nickel transport system ATP-binding protein